MFGCQKCGKIFKTKTKLKAHGLRKSPCKPPEFYCVLCKKGLKSYRTMWEHRRICMKRPDTSFVEQERVCLLKKRVNRFLSRLSIDFPTVLDKLEELFPPDGESTDVGIPCSNDEDSVRTENAPKREENNII